MNPSIVASTIKTASEAGHAVGFKNGYLHGVTQMAYVIGGCAILGVFLALLTRVGQSQKSNPKSREMTESNPAPVFQPKKRVLQ